MDTRGQGRGGGRTSECRDGANKEERKEDERESREQDERDGERRSKENKERGVRLFQGLVTACGYDRSRQEGGSCV